MSRLLPALIVTAAGALACGGPVGSVPGTTDVGLRDGGARALDAGPTDGESRDAGEVPDPPDAGPVDLGVAVDAGDAPSSDASTPPPEGGCGRPAPSRESWTLSHDGRDRTYAVHLPPGYDPDVPTALVFDLHGRTFTAEAQASLTRMRDVADREGFIVVHPQGIGRTWNGGICCGEASREDVDDVGFVRAMIEALEADLCVDPDRVFATGMSNGGFLAHRLACELADRIAAIAPVAGVMGVSDCAPARPVPVLHFHGNNDQVVRYDGVAGYLSAPASASGWAQRNGCAANSNPTFTQDDVSCEAWTGCTDGADVELCTIDGGGHTWPGGTPLPLLGRTTQTISASDRAWAFFAAHPRP